MNKTRTAVATPSIVHTSTGTGDYHVRYTITVDRPWLRGATYAPVAPGSKIHMTHRFKTQGAAVREYESIIRGDQDFISEYVSRVYVEAATPGKARRTVRRCVERTFYRPASVLTDRELARPALAAAATNLPGRRMVFLHAAWDTSDYADIRAAA
jgi:hypothetical protein